MNINRNNYAAFFIDYFDGNLSEADCAVLFSFLDQHLDLKEEFDSFENLCLQPATNIEYTEKSGLKKPSINQHNYQTYLIASLENDLDINAQKQLDLFIQKNPYSHFEAVLYEKTKLPATVEVFEQKKKLKRPVIVPFYIQYKYQLAVAASVAILFLFSQLFFTANEAEQKLASDNSVRTIKSVESNSTIPNINNKLAINSNESSHSNSTNESTIKTQIIDQNIEKISLKKASFLLSDNSINQSTVEKINLELIAFATFNELSENNSNEAEYATIINEVDNPESESQFSQLAGNTISRLSNKAVNLGSKKTKSGLLKSWKLQAGNFKIAHNKY